MSQVWHDLLFAHWPISPELMRKIVPPQLPLDLYDGKCWVGVVPFWMSGVRPRAIPPLLGLSKFPELNVRTYVTLENKPGVYFFSLDARSHLTVWGAKTFFNLPYYFAQMSVTRDQEWFYYHSKRTDQPAELRGRYRETGPIFHAQAGTLEHFLAERYCLYTVSRNVVYRCEIHHAPWPLQTAEAEFAKNTMAQAAGVDLPSVQPLLHFARRQDVIVWPLQTLSHYA
jgi:uncharacterized protein YqjF (DUF2071 family)